MAIKRRTDPATEAAIEAFGAGAEALTSPAVAPRAPAARPSRAAAARPAAKKPSGRAEDVAKTFLIRYPDESLPLLLAEMAQIEDRSQHAVALRALRRGLEAMKADAES
ncbi:hypothetical protein [Herbiconiux sp. YIM B11900]|uniref:hypothetical protein n=1 Tax=Herbiconiux sp. YIM B11900 TaxID=3404131 RepID=UPI003F8430BD